MAEVRLPEECVGGYELREVGTHALASEVACADAVVQNGAVVLAFKGPLVNDTIETDVADGSCAARALRAAELATSTTDNDNVPSRENAPRYYVTVGAYALETPDGSPVFFGSSADAWTLEIAAADATPNNANPSDFPVKPGSDMPAVQGCHKQDYAVVFVVGIES